MVISFLRERFVIAFGRECKFAAYCVPALPRDVSRCHSFQLALVRSAHYGACHDAGGETSPRKAFVGSFGSVLCPIILFAFDVYRDRHTDLETQLRTGGFVFIILQLPVFALAACLLLSGALGIYRLLKLPTVIREHPKAIASYVLELVGLGLVVRIFSAFFLWS